MVNVIREYLRMVCSLALYSLAEKGTAEAVFPVVAV